MDARVLALLPPALRRLRVASTEFSELCLLRLPAALTELEMQQCVPERTFKQLKLDPSSEQREAAKASILALATHSFFLTRTLTSLTIGRLEIQDIEWFTNLPPLLEKLEVNAVKMPIDAFCHLQMTSLTSITIKISNAVDPMATIPFENHINLPNLLRNLPRQIEHFSFILEKEMPWIYEGIDLKRLPPRLQSLQLPAMMEPATFGPELLAYLPRSLAVLFTGFQHLGWFYADRIGRNNRKQSIYKANLWELQHPENLPKS
jgi:hypothetical protein